MGQDIRFGGYNLDRLSDYLGPEDFGTEALNRHMQYFTYIMSNLAITIARIVRAIFSRDHNWHNNSAAERTIRLFNQLPQNSPDKRNPELFNKILNLYNALATRRYGWSNYSYQLGLNMPILVVDAPPPPGPARVNPLVAPHPVIARANPVLPRGVPAERAVRFPIVYQNGNLETNTGSTGILNLREYACRISGLGKPMNMEMQQQIRNADEVIAELRNVPDMSEADRAFIIEATPELQRSSESIRRAAERRNAWDIPSMQDKVEVEYTTLRNRRLTSAIPAKTNVEHARTTIERLGFSRKYQMTAQDLGTEYRYCYFEGICENINDPDELFSLAIQNAQQELVHGDDPQICSAIAVYNLLKQAELRNYCNGERHVHLSDNLYVQYQEPRLYYNSNSEPKVYFTPDILSSIEHGCDPESAKILIERYHNSSEQEIKAHLSGRPSRALNPEEEVLCALIKDMANQVRARYYEKACEMQKAERSGKNVAPFVDAEDLPQFIRDGGTLAEYIQNLRTPYRIFQYSMLYVAQKLANAGLVGDPHTELTCSDTLGRHICRATVFELSQLIAREGDFTFSLNPHVRVECGKLISYEKEEDGSTSIREHFLSNPFFQIVLDEEGSPGIPGDPILLACMLQTQLQDQSQRDFFENVLLRDTYHNIYSTKELNDSSFMNRKRAIEEMFERAPNALQATIREGVLHITRIYQNVWEHLWPCGIASFLANNIQVADDAIAPAPPRPLELNGIRFHAPLQDRFFDEAYRRFIQIKRMPERVYPIADYLKVTNENIRQLASEQAIELAARQENRPQRMRDAEVLVRHAEYERIIAGQLTGAQVIEHAEQLVAQSDGLYREQMQQRQREIALDLQYNVVDIASGSSSAPVGSCLFGALAHQIFEGVTERNVGEYIHVLRRAVVMYIRENHNEFIEMQGIQRNFANPANGVYLDETLPNYTQRLQQALTERCNRMEPLQGIEGGPIEIAALAKILGVRIEIFDCRAELRLNNGEIIPNTTFENERAGAPVRILFRSDRGESGHYLSLIEKS